MPRQLRLVPLLVVLAIVAMTAGSYAQSSYLVTGRIVSVSYIACGNEAVYGGVQYICRDWVQAEYVAPDQVLRRASVEAQTYDGIRPAANDIVTCIIDANTYNLQRVDGWYHLVDISPGYGYAQPYYPPSYIVERPYYGRPYGGFYYDSPRYRIRRGSVHRHRYVVPPPRYDREPRYRHYDSPAPAPRSSPGEYRQPGGRGHYEPAPGQRTPRTDNSGLRPAPGYPPGSPRGQSPPQYQTPERRQQRPMPAERPRDSGDRSTRPSGERPRPRR